DLANRLPRGRAYLRNGSVLDLAIGRGRVEAYVAGTELYRVTIGMAPLAKTRWRRVVTRCTGRIGSLIGLLRGEVSSDVLAVLTGVAIRLDARPELFFELRQADQAELIDSATAGVVTRGRPAEGKRIAADRLSAVFGIELEDGAPAHAARSPRRPSSRRQK